MSQLSLEAASSLEASRCTGEAGPAPGSAAARRQAAARRGALGWGLGAAVPHPIGGKGPGRGGPTSERAAGRENFVPCLVSTCFRRAFAQAAVSGSEIRWRASSLR